MAGARTDADWIVAGAGLAGLSLAVAWLERRPERGRMLLLEPRAEHVHDRSWCGFRTESHPFRSCVTHRWRRWRVRGDGRTVERGDHRHPYEHVPAGALYDEALARIAASPRVELRRSVRVEHIDEEAGLVTVRTDAGALRAPVVLDGRPPNLPEAAPPGEIRLWQHFLGWELRTERPAFDPDVATLMDFEVDQDRGIHFVYVLPFAPDRALVEDTYFTTARRFDREIYEASLHGWIARELGDASFRVERVEHGVLPMTTEPFPPHWSRRVLRIGLGGGLAKPSTGYAFAFVQRHAAALAARLEPGRIPEPPPAHPPHAALLDRVFLSWLAREPARAPAAFADLFEATPPAALARFLNENGGLRDHLRVLSALPPGPLTAEALRTLPRAWHAARRGPQSQS